MRTEAAGFMSLFEPGAVCDHAFAECQNLAHVRLCEPGVV